MTQPALPAICPKCACGFTKAIGYRNEKVSTMGKYCPQCSEFIPCGWRLKAAHMAASLEAKRLHGKSCQLLQAAEAAARALAHD